MPGDDATSLKHSWMTPRVVICLIHFSKMGLRLIELQLPALLHVVQGGTIGEV